MIELGIRNGQEYEPLKCHSLGKIEVTPAFGWSATIFNRLASSSVS
jgi:hypothetical protein